MTNLKVECTLNQATVLSLFKANSFLCGKRDVIPEYRIVELFGNELATWIDECTGYGGYLKNGSDYCIWGEYISIRFFYLDGFLKCASEYNSILSQKLHSQSAAGKLIDAVFAERVRRLEEEDEAARD